MTRLIGLFSTLFGLIGTVLCLAMIAAIWVFHSNLLGSGIHPLAPAEKAFDLLNQAMQQTSKLIDDTQTKLRNTDPDNAVSNIATLTSNTQSQVAVARHTLTTLNQFFGSFQQVLDLVGASGMHNLSTGLDNKLSQFQQDFSEIEQLASRIGKGGSVNQLSSKLDRLQTKVDTVVDGIDEGQTAMANLQAMVPKVLLIAACVLTVLLLWLACGQWLLTRWGWRRLFAPASH